MGRRKKDLGERTCPTCDCGFTPTKSQDLNFRHQKCSKLYYSVECASSRPRDLLTKRWERRGE